MIKKYFAFFKLTFGEYFTYRFNFVINRLRNIVSLLVLIFFWQTVFAGKSNFLGYQKSQMLTYIVGVSFLNSLVFGKKIAGLAGAIKSGELASRYLLRPVSVLKTYFSIDAAARVLNVIFSCLELFLVVKLLKIDFYFPENIFQLVLFFIACLISIFLYFFIDFLISSVAFWVDNIWAPRWLFGVIFLELLSGLIFPLDVLPKIVLRVISFTPFPYLIFFPLKIYIGQITSIEALKVILIMVFYLLVFSYITLFYWKKGLKVYSSYGG